MSYTTQLSTYTQLRRLLIALKTTFRNNKANSNTFILFIIPSNLGTRKRNFLYSLLNKILSEIHTNRLKFNFQFIDIY